MLSPITTLLDSARDCGYAVGAFNVYNLEGVRAVISAAETQGSPAILQLHPGALRHGGGPLVALCLAAASAASVPIAVHLDHSDSLGDIRVALDSGLTSVMADGSHLAYSDNVAFTRRAAEMVRGVGGSTEGELGRLAGTEDDLAIPDNQAKLTDPDRAADFVLETGVDTLAICIGNAHGRYRSKPCLDLERLIAIREAVSVPLVLHGASGLPNSTVRRTIELGVCKFNVNTEVREAYISALKQGLNLSDSPDLLDLMHSGVRAMQGVISAKLRLFGSAGTVSRTP